MKKDIQHKIDSLRSSISKVSKEGRIAPSLKRDNSLSVSIRNEKEAENFKAAYEAAKSLARKK